MKIIDLLNKIANGEEVPEKIKYFNDILFYDGEDNESNNYHATFNYYDENDNNGLFDGNIGKILNVEVKIIEKEKKIPEKLDVLVEIMSSDKIGALTKEISDIQRSFNQLLDYLKSKGE